MTTAAQEQTGQPEERVGFRGSVPMKSYVPRKTSRRPLYNGREGASRSILRAPLTKFGTRTDDFF